jgi:hypothetical protein
LSRVDGRGRTCRGLLAPLAGKNGWTLAEDAGYATPDGMQRLLNSAHWDANRVRDDLRGYAVEHLGEVAGVLIVDAGLRPDPFPDRAASLLPGLLTATRTGLTPAGDDELPIKS